MEIPEAMIPKTYLERNNRNNNRFLFISYKHDDIDRVFPILRELYDKGVNFWYDKAMMISNTWTEAAQNQLSLLNCKGILFFLSKAAIGSNSILEEIQMTKCMKETKSPFAIIPVLLDFNDYDDIVHNLTGPKRRLFDEVFDYGEKIYGRLSDGKDKLIEQIFKIASSIYVTEDNYIKLGNDNFLKLKNISETKNGIYLRLGQYYFDNKENRKDIDWKLFCQIDHFYYLVTEYCLDFEPYSSAHQLENIIYKDLKQLDYVQSVSLITEDVIQKYSEKIGPAVSTNFAESIRAQQLRVFWVADEKDKNILYLYNSDNKKVDIDLNYKTLTINAGIRLILCIDSKKITEE